MASNEPSVVEARVIALESDLDSDPKHAFDEGMVLLEEIKDDPGTAARVEHIIGLAARGLDLIPESIAYLERAVADARRAARSDIESSALTTLAVSRAYAGDMIAAIADLEAAIAQLQGVDRARAQVQRAGLLSRSGDHAASIEATTEALPSLVDADDHVWLGHAYTNRGIAFGTTRQLSLAYKDLDEAERRYGLAEHAFGVAATLENRGFVATRAGDVLAAMRSLERAQKAYEEIGVSLGPLMKTRADLALLAGMPKEAYRLATRQLELLESGSVEIERPLALHVSARAALLDGRLTEAAAAAAEAAVLFSDQGRDAWCDRARFVETLAYIRADDRGHEIDIEDLAERLDTYGLGFEASQLRMEGALNLGSEELRRAGLTRVSENVRVPRIDLALQGWHARALIANLDGDTELSSRAIEQGLQVFRSHQQSLGATELRLRATVHARQLAQLGIGTALDNGNPRDVFQAVEQGRALATDSFSLVSASLDVTELAEIETRAREAETPEDLNTASVELETWEAVASSRPQPHTLEELEGQIEAGELAAFVTIGLFQDESFAVTISPEGTELRRIGQTRDILATAAHIRSALRAPAAGAGPEEEALTAGLVRLDGILSATLADLGPRVVICPTPELGGVPWSALPSLRQAAVSVVPSAASWLACLEQPDNASGRVFVSGPGLIHGESEVSLLAMSEDEILVGREATRDEILDRISGARIAHIAAHGDFSEENAFLSRLEVADGPLLIQDLAGLHQMPSTVVLSACDLGLSERSDAALTGFATALLGLGARSVVAAMAPVPDTESLVEYMSLLHDAFVKTPSAALAAHAARDRGAQRTVATAFQVFGY